MSEESGIFDTIEKEGEIEMSLYFGVFISLFAYLIGMKLKKKFG